MDESKGKLGEKTIKNSMYNTLTTIIQKIGGLVFTIILARLLMPELFGVYNLVLSIILVTLTFADLGIGKTITRYVSEALGEKSRGKAKSYLRYLIKIKGILTILIILIIIILAEFLAKNIFQKPEIYLPLIVATLYFFMQSMFGIFKSIFGAMKDFRKISIMQTVLQLLRISLATIAILILSPENAVSGIFVALAIAVFFTSLVGLILLRKDRNLVFGQAKEKIDKKRITNYLTFVSLVTISLAFFGSIDTLILGGFVESSYIGFYRAAFGLAMAAASLINFGAVLLPAFTQIHGNRLERGFQKSFRYLSILSIPLTVGILIIAKYIIFAIYGREYLTATTPLYILSFLILITPFVALYSTLIEAKEKPKILSKAILWTLAVNVILDFALIMYLLDFGQEYAILGAGIATVVSRGIYLGILTKKHKSLSGIKTDKAPLFKALFSSLIMGGFLFAFFNYLDIDVFLGIIGVLLAIVIYFLIMYLIKGINKKDFNLIRDIFYKKFNK